MWVTGLLNKTYFHSTTFFFHESSRSGCAASLFTQVSIDTLSLVNKHYIWTRQCTTCPTAVLHSRPILQLHPNLSYYTPKQVQLQAPTNTLRGSFTLVLFTAELCRAFSIAKFREIGDCFRRQFYIRCRRFKRSNYHTKFNNTRNSFEIIVFCELFGRFWAVQ